MQIPIQKVLHPADLFVARKALESFQSDQESLLSHMRKQNYMIFEISFWDKGQWREHRDVPDERMYYFGIGADQEPQECLDAIKAWLESEIDRVENLLVCFYREHETIISPQVEHSNSHRLVSISGNVYGILPGLTMGCGLSLMYSGSRLPGGIFLFGGVILLVIILTLIRRPQATQPV